MCVILHPVHIAGVQVSAFCPSFPSGVPTTTCSGCHHRCCLIPECFARQGPQQLAGAGFLFQWGIRVDPLPCPLEESQVRQGLAT